MSSCSGLFDWSGWIAASLAWAGALLVLRPLFILLRHREALDMLVYSSEVKTPPEELKADFIEARKVLAQKVFEGRDRWKPWAWSALAVLAAASVPLAYQFACLI